MTAARLTLTNPLAGSGTLISSGGGTLALTGDNTGVATPLWLWQRGNTSTGAQVELGAVTGNAIGGDIMLGNAQHGGSGHSVLQLFGNFSGTTTAGSANLTDVSAPASIAIGMPVTGPGIPAGTTVTDVDVSTKTVTLSASATASATGVTLGATRTNQNQIADTATIWFDGGTGPDRNNYFKLMGADETVGRLVDMGGRAVIENREGDAGVPTGSILSVAGNQDSRVIGFIRDNSGSNVQQADGFVLGGDVTNGSNAITNVVTPSALAVGMVVTGYGIPANTTITAISGTTVTLSAPANLTRTGGSMHASAANSLGIAKSGTGTLSLSGGNIIYSGSTTIDGGTLRLSNTTNFRSHITNNAHLILDATGTWNFTKSFSDPDGAAEPLPVPPIERLTVKGFGDVTKTGAGTFVFSSLDNEIGMLSVQNGTLQLSSATEVTGGIVAAGDMSLNRSLRFFGNGTTIQGGINATGRFGQASGTLSTLTFSGGLGTDSLGVPVFVNSVTGVAGPITIRHTDLVLDAALVTFTRPTDDVATSNSTTVVLNDVSNLIVGMKVTGTGVPADTVLQSVNFTTKTITLSKPSTIPASTQLDFRITSHGDGRIIGIGAGVPDSLTIIGNPAAAGGVGPGRIRLNNTFEANNADRLPNTTPIISKGGLLEFRNDGTNSVFAETLGALNLANGHLQVAAFRSGETGSSTLTFGSLSHGRGATVEFVGRDLSSGSEAAANDTLGADVRNRIMFGTSPTLAKDLIGGWAVAGTQFATYGANGVMPLPLEKQTRTNQTTWAALDNVNAVMTQNETLNARRMINSLNFNGGRTMALAGFPLAIRSGGILANSGTSNITATGGGLLTVPVATGSSAELFMHVLSGTLNVSAPIRDSDIQQSMTGTAGTNSATVSSAAGLVPGMTVSGAGIPAGTTIVSVNYQANSIVLSNSLIGAVSGSRNFTGGSVDLVKSGVGTMVLSGDNEFTGKAIINNGVLRISLDGHLGSVPSSFESDKIILNGGVLQLNGSIDIAANRGITINEAGGRIEVGTANSNQFTVNIPAPMTVNGVLELAVRADPNADTQSVLNLGTVGGGNNFPMGIKTEGTFEGRINLLGNNTLGGLFMEGGDMVMAGNNNFTGDIRVAGGKWTVSGSNTFNGAAAFPEPIIVTNGLLSLQSATAFGTAPFALELANTAEVRLNGINQTLRSIVGSAGTAIVNRSDTFTPATLTLDLETNQTFSGRFQDVTGKLSITKTGPGRLLLDNVNGSSFTGVLRIEQGSIEVDSVALGTNASPLGSASSAAANIVLAGGSLAFSPTREQITDRSFTLGAGATGGTLVANGTTQTARMILGVEFVTPSIAFEGSGPRTLTLSGFNVGDNEFNMELGDRSAAEPTSLMKIGAGTWVLGKAEPFTGMTTIQDGVLAIRTNNALGTASVPTTVNSGANTFTGNVPNGVQVNFPNLNGSTLPIGLAADIPYYVVQSTGSTFKVSLTPGGAPVSVGNSGTGVTYTSNINPIASTVASFSLDQDNNPLPGTFTGNLPTGTALTFATRQFQVAAPTAANPYAVSNPNGTLPTGISSTTTYYVVNADGNQFQVSTTPGGSPVTFTSNGNEFFYSAVPVSNKSGGVNLVGGRMDLRDVNYATPETLFFEGGSLFLPAGSHASWAGNMQVNVNSNITLAPDSVLTLEGNLLGNRTFNQLGEGTLILRGEAIAPATVSDNFRRAFVVQAGTLVLDYSSNNNSKLIDTATLQVGGGRRGGSIRLSGGSHEEIVNALSLQAGANTIYRDSGTGVIRLNSISRGTGASIYFDQPDIARVDNFNLPTANGVLGAWAIIRNTANNEYDWAKNGSNSNDGFVVPNNDPSPDPFTRGANTTVVSNFTRPSGLSAWTLRFVQDAARTVTFTAANPNAAPTVLQTGGILISPTVGANDSIVTGAGKLTTQNQGNLQNFIIHQYNEQADLIINNPLVDRAVFTREGMLTFNDPIEVRRGITGLATTADLTVGMTVTGTGIPGGTTIVTILDDTSVVLSADHSVNGTQPTLTFGGSIVRVGTLPPSVARRVISGVDVLGTSVLSNDDLLVGMAVTGSGIPAGATIAAILNNNTIVISANHSYNDSRVRLTFAGGAVPDREGSFNSANVRRIIGLKRPDESILSATSDLYLGMLVSGPGIPAGATIDFIWPGSTSGSTDSRDIRINADHTFNGIGTTMTFTPVIGIEKLGPGTLVLGGASTYTGVTFIGNGTVRAQTLTDGGVAGSLGASSAAAGNLTFNGGTLQYIGEHSATNRGLTLTDFAAVNVGHERTIAGISGSISGADTFEKTGPGTLVMRGSAGLSDLRVNEGRLQVQIVDTNFTASGFGQSNFGNTNLTAVHLAGGVLEVRGTEEGNVSQTYGGQLYVERGGSEVRSTSVAGFNPANLNSGAVGRNTSIALMGGEEISQVFRNSGGTVRFVENPEANGGRADIFLNLPNAERANILPWAVYWNTSDTSAPNVKDFAAVDITTGAVVPANGELRLENSSAKYMDPDNWGATDPGFSLNLVEGSFEAFNGTLTDDREVNTLRYAFDGDSTVNIPVGNTLRLISGAILISSEVRGGRKEIVGGGDIRGGAVAVDGRDMIVHNYNTGSTFTMGVNIINEEVDITNSGSTIAGSREIRVGFGGALALFDLRPGMAISGDGIEPGTVVQSVSQERFRIQLSKPVTVTQTNASFHFTDVSSFVHSGIGTTELSGNNTYAGSTFLNGGVLRLNSPNAIPGGIGTAGGTSALRIEGGVLGLGEGNFSRGLGTGIDQVEFQGSGGFAAYDANRLVNLGGAAAKLRFGNNSFIPDGSSLLLGAQDATHMVTLLNPMDLGSFSQVVRTDNGPAPIEGELAGALSGLGRLIKLGLGSLRLAAANTHSGGVEVAEGTLVAANVSNVFGTSAGVVRMGTSATNTSPSAGLTLQVEGGTVTNALSVGNVNAPGKAWRTDVRPDTGAAGADVGQHTAHLVVNGNPAIAYYDLTNGDLKFVRSTDASGSIWPAPVIVDSAGDVGQFASLQIINGVPAVSYYDATNNNLKFVRATDASGGAWGTPVIVLGGIVNAQALQADDKLLIGGSFIGADGGERGNLARINADGTVDGLFDPKTDLEIRAIAVQSDGKILIGGAFTSVDGTTRNRIARLNSSGTLDTFNPNANNQINAIAVQPADGKILIGGSFTSIGGVTRNRIARLNADGSLDASFNPNANGTVTSIAVQSDGRILVGGSFGNIAGFGYNNIARLNADGTRDTGFANPNANTQVTAIAVQTDGMILIGGTFTSVSGIARNRVARLNSNGTLDASFNPNANNEVRAIAVQADGAILIGGTFTAVGGESRNRVARLLATGAVDTTFDPDVSGTVQTVLVRGDGRVALGGSFANVGGVGRNWSAQVHSNGSLDAVFLPRLGTGGQFNSLQTVNGNPAISYYDNVTDDLKFVRSTNANGTAWDPAVTVSATADVGQYTSLQIVGISSTSINGYPAISYYDVTNGNLKYVRSLNADGTPNINGEFWATPQTIDSTGDVGQYTTLLMVADQFTIAHPAISYYDATNGDLKYIRANDVHGSGGWGTPVTVDSTGDVGSHASLQIVNNNPIVDGGTPAIAYYDATGGNLKYVRALDQAGSSWGAPMVVLDTGDVGRFTSLQLINGNAAMSFYDATSGDLRFARISDAAGFSRLAFGAAATWQGNVTLDGSLMLAPAAGQTAALNGIIAGAAGLRLITAGTIDLTNAANTFGATLTPGAAINGGAIVRAGTLRVTNSTALGTTTVELGDARPFVLTVDRATSPGASLTLAKGSFRPNHNGQNPTFNGPGAFVEVAPVIDGFDYSAGSTTATVVAGATSQSRGLTFSGALADGTAVRFYGATLPAIIQGDTTYYVVESTGSTFHVAATLGGPALAFTRPPLTTLPASGTTYALTYFLHFGKLILVKDEAANPERNGVYEVFFNGLNQPAGTISLGRVASMDSVAELAYGTSVNVANGTSMGKAFFIGSIVSNLNVSAVQWVDDISNPQLALVAAAAGVVVSNPIDVNAVNPTGTSSLGGAATLTSGNVTFNGSIVLQDLKPAVQETQTLSLTSATSTGLGVIVAGLISEADGGNGPTNDHLALAKTGPGIVSITGANTHTGGLSVNEGTLLVMNTTGSATGTGPVSVNAGAVLGGTGFIGGNVTLQGADLNNAILRPGDPTSVAGPVETLTINGTLTVGADAVVQYTLGTDNYNKLIANSVSVMPTGRLLVQLGDNYVPPTGTQFDILDGTLTFTAGGQVDLRDYLKLPGQYLWDASQFVSQGKITVNGEAVPVAITLQPTGQTVNPGSNVTFSVTVSGSADFRYQWQKNVGGTFVDIGPAATWTSATTSTFPLNDVVEADEGTYRVIVQNGWDGYFTEISTVVTLLVNDPPNIVTHPLTQTVNPGVDAVFTVVAGGPPPYSYQWQKFNGTFWANLAGATTDTLTLPGVTEASEGDYRVRVSNNAGPVLSDPATLTVNDPVAFTTHPVSQTKSVGDTVTFTAVATGTAAITYQWQRSDTGFNNWADIPGATSNSYTIGVIQDTHAGDYRVVATNLVNSLPSNPATLTAIVGLPFFSQHPAPQMIQLGNELRLEVNAEGAEPITYQWYKAATAATNPGTKIAGATNPVYVVAADKLALTHAGVYRCIATNSLGPVKSNAAEVGVVNNILKTLVIASDATATMNCLAAGNGLQYKWKKGNTYLVNDLRIGGATTKTLTIKKTVVEDAGDYHCEVTGLAGGPIVAGSHKLSVVNEKPVILGAEPIQMPKAFIGATYDYTIPVDPASNRAAVSFAASGLPAGLKIDTKTGRITGRPTATKGPVAYAVTLSATNMKGTTKVAALLIVEPVPAGALGVFAGPIERHVMLNENLGGRFDLTVAAAGTFSGKVTLGVTSYSFASGLLIVDPAGVQMPKGEAIIKRTGKPSLKVTFTIDSANHRLVADVNDSTDNVAAQAWRNIWSTTAINLGNCATVNGSPNVTCASTAQLRVGMYVTGPAGSSIIPANARVIAIVDATTFTLSANATVTSDPLALPKLTAVAAARSYQGLYNVGLDITAADEGDPLVPQGTGYMSFTVAAAGTLTIAGKTPDGESLTGGAFVGPLGEVLIFQTLYTTKPKGSILGSLDIDSLNNEIPTDNTVAGAATQLRQPNPAITHRIYRAGFFIDLGARGGAYVTPKAMGTLILGIPVAFRDQYNSLLSFSDITTALSPNVNVIAGDTGVKVPTDNASPNVGKKTKLTVNATTGVFNGTISLTDNNPNPPPATVSRNGTFNGVIVPENGGWAGYGFYLLSDLPDAGAGTTDKTAPIKSGQVLFE